MDQNSNLERKKFSFQEWWCYMKPLIIFPYIRLLQETCSSGRPRSDTSCKKPCRRSYMQDACKTYNLANVQEKWPQSFKILQESWPPTRFLARYIRSWLAWTTSFLQEPYVWVIMNAWVCSKWCIHYCMALRLLSRYAITRQTSVSV